VVVGFTGGGIPEVRVNRLLLNNVSVVGAGWGAYAMGKPDFLRETGAQLERMIEAGDVRPVVGVRLPFAQAAEALRVIERREAVGKVVLER
jgi:NADPH2:quinone reductase